MSSGGPDEGSFRLGEVGFIDPRLLQAGRSQLKGEKVLRAWHLRAAGSLPPSIEIDRRGVIVDGNSRARVAAMRGEQISYRVVPGPPTTGYGPVMERPLFWEFGPPTDIPWAPSSLGTRMTAALRRIARFFRR